MAAPVKVSFAALAYAGDPPARIHGIDPHPSFTVAGTLTDGAAPVVFPEMIYLGTDDEGTSTWRNAAYASGTGYAAAGNGQTWSLVKVASSTVIAQWNGTRGRTPLDVTDWDADTDETGTPVLSASAPAASPVKIEF